MKEGEEKRWTVRFCRKFCRVGSISRGFSFVFFFLSIVETSERLTLFLEKPSVRNRFIDTFVEKIYLVVALAVIDATLPGPMVTYSFK